MEVRKYFAYSQLAECLDHEKISTTLLSVFRSNPSRWPGEMIAPSHVWVQWSVSSRKRTDPATTWSQRDAPDLYYVALNNSTAPLVVKTLKDSLLLTKMFKVHQITRFVWISLLGSSSQYDIELDFFLFWCLIGVPVYPQYSHLPEGHDVTS
jgi:hypothetical protein